MDRNLDYTLLYRVSKAYFKDQRTQQEIADVENFSRSQISRLLKRALEEELVTYALNFPVEIDEAALSKQLCDLLGLDRVVLIPSFYGDFKRVNQDEVSKNLALGVADKLADLLGEARNIGVGWGRTMYNASLYVRPPQRTVRGRVFIPLIGLSGENSPMFQINTIVDRFGERFHADRNYVNMQSLQLRDSMPTGGQDYFNTLREKWKELDAAIIGIGGPPANNKNLIYEFPRAYKKQIQTSGTVGDILSQFFYEDGRNLELDSHFSLLAMNIMDLKDVPNVIAIASGPEKCQPIYAAAKMGYIKTLVTDYDTGIQLLKYKGE